MNQENLNRNLVNTARFPKALASIEETRDYMKPMRELTLFKDEIKKHTNIRTETFTGAELNKQRRCLRCKKRTHYGHTQRESRGQSQLCLDSFCYCDKDIIFRHSWLIGEDPWSKAKDRPCPLKISVLDGYKRGTLSHSKVAAPHDPISYINSMMKMENEVVDPQIDGSLHLYGHVHKDYRRTGEVYEDIEVYRVYEVYQFSDKAWKDAQSRIHVPSCIHHFGELKSSTWSCCQKSVYAEGCVKWLEHSKPRAWSYDEDESILYQTPECKRDPPNARSAVVLRCSMIQYLKVEPELLRLSAVDYYTGEILIDSLVSHGYGLDFTDPRSTGISLEMYHAAEERGETIWSRDAARSALWRIVGPRTRLIVSSRLEELAMSSPGI